MASHSLIIKFREWLKPQRGITWRVEESKGYAFGLYSH